MRKDADPAMKVKKSKLDVKVLLPLLCLFGLADTPAQACSCGAKVSSVKANMHTLQTMLESYGVDWGGQYPAHVKALRKEAQTSANPYWKDIINPMTSKSTQRHLEDVVRNYQDVLYLALKPGCVAVILGIPLDFGEPVAGEPGRVVYDAVSEHHYFIYGLDKEGHLIKDKGQPFVLSNS